MADCAVNRESIMTTTFQGSSQFTKSPVAAFHGLPPLPPPPPNTQWQASQHTDLATWQAEATEAAKLGQSLSQLYLNIDFWSQVFRLDF